MWKPVKLTDLKEGMFYRWKGKRESRMSFSIPVLIIKIKNTDNFYITITELDEEGKIGPFNYRFYDDDYFLYEYYIEDDGSK